MSSFMGENPWMYGVIAFILLCLVLAVCLLWRCRRSSRSTYSAYVSEDENSTLLSPQGGVTKFIRTTESDGLDHTLMTCQLYIREKSDLEFLQTYSPRGIRNNSIERYWFSVKSTCRTSTPGVEKCVVKVIPGVKISAHMNHVSLIMETFLEILLTIKGEASPFLRPVLDLKFVPDRESIVIVNGFAKSGSLRDKMLKVKPFSRLHKNKTSRRTKSYRCAKPLPLEKIRVYSKQILLGLVFLDRLGFPLKKTKKWLHAGNVLLEEGKCQLTGYEMELMDTLASDQSAKTDSRAGLDSAALIIFEMATGFPVNYAQGMIAKSPSNGSSFGKEETLREIHYEYLEQCGRLEVSQLLRFMCEEEKCTSLQMSMHHPFFDQVTKFHHIDPETAAIASMKTLTKRLQKYTRSRSRPSNVNDHALFLRQSKRANKVSQV